MWFGVLVNILLNVECVLYRLKASKLSLSDFILISVLPPTLILSENFNVTKRKQFPQILPGQARSPLSNAIVPYSDQHNGHVQIELIDVKCENGNDILVTIDFDGPFSGIVYSQGYFNDPKCR